MGNYAPLAVEGVDDNNKCLKVYDWNVMYERFLVDGRESNDELLVV